MSLVSAMLWHEAILVRKLRSPFRVWSWFNSRMLSILWYIRPFSCPCLLKTKQPLGGQIRTIRKGSYSCISGSRNRRVSTPLAPHSLIGIYRLLQPSRKLGGQALVLDVEGAWRELTGVVNKLAANLTNQVHISSLCSHNHC